MQLKEHQKESIKRDLRLGIGLVIVLALVFGSYLVSVPISVFQTLTSFIFFLVFISFYLLQANTTLLKTIRADAADQTKIIFLVPAVAWLASAVYALLSGQFDPALLAKGLLFCLVPAAFVYLNAKRLQPSGWLDLLIVISLWFPIEFGLINGLTLPPTRGLAEVYHLIGIALVIFFFFGVRGLRDVGFTFRLKDKDIRIAVQNFIIFMPFALVIGMATGFIAISDRLPSGMEMLASFIGILFFIAIPEEILFRGVIHNLIEKKLSDRKNGVMIALAISSVVFGLAHGNNNNPPFLDINFGPLGVWHAPWVYLLLATFAGFFYGWTFIKTRKVTAAAIVHLLVDWVWSTFFAG